MKKITLFFTAIIFWLNGFSQDPAIQWQNTIGGNSIDDLYCGQQTTDGGYIFGGRSNSGISGDKTENTVGGNSTFDYWVVKTDATGNIQWENTIGGDDGDYLISIQQTFDGGYILGGYSSSGISGDKTEIQIGNLFHDYWILKTDAAGNIQWQNTIGGNVDDRLASVRQTIDGGYILGGTSNSNISADKTENSHGSEDYWIVKTDSLGSIQWQNTIGGSYNDYLVSVLQTADGGYILGGISNSNASGDKTENNRDTTAFTDDYWIVKTNSLGGIQWQNTIGGNSIDYLTSIQQTTDGGYILGGYSWSNISGDKTENNLDTSGFTTDYWIIKADGLGNIQWQKTIGGISAEVLGYVQQTADMGYILYGYSESNISGDKTENCHGSSSDYWIVKLSPDVGFEELEADKTFSLFPNPATSELRIKNSEFRIEKIEIYSSLGEKVYSRQPETSNQQHVTISIADFPPGIYFITVTDQAGNKVTKKVVKM